MDNVDLKADKTYVTENEGYNESGKIANKIEKLLDRIITDTYNNQYVIRVIVTIIDNNDTDVTNEEVE